MSQTRVTKHFSVRKHNTEGIKQLDKIVSKQSEVKNVSEKLKNADTSKEKTDHEKLQKNYNSSIIEKKRKNIQSTLKTFFTSEVDKPKNGKVTNESDKNSASVPVISQKNSAKSEISSSTSSPKRNVPYLIRDVDESEICSLTRSPKRNRPSPTDEGTPSKRKHLETSVTSSEVETVTIPKRKVSARRKLKLESDDLKTGFAAPLKTDKNLTDSKVETTVHRKLRLDSPSNKTRINVELSRAKINSNSRSDLLEIVHSPKREQSFCNLKVNSPRKIMLDAIAGKSRADVYSASPKKNFLGTPDKLDALIDSSRSTMVLSAKRDELKKALRLFSEKTGIPKECHSSPRKSITPSSPKSPEKKLPSRRLFACEPFNHVIQTESLVLPRKYKLLAEMFRNMDALIATLNNRKQEIRFEVVKESLQRILKKDINEKHLGQIVTVFPSAYSLSRERARCITKKNNSDYPLVIVPNIASEEDADDNQKRSAFQRMTPLCLASRIDEFNNNLLGIVKGHHQDFLKKINFAAVSDDKIKQWHSKFPVNTVPDIPVAQLPELPERKVYTAKDVLNKIKDLVQTKVGKALQSVADDTEKSGVICKLEEIKSSKSEASKKALKGISNDLLEKIRAKESAKLLKTMTQTPEEKKKLAMIERVPKIAKIVQHYFMSNRKTALLVDAVVDNIKFCLNSLSTPDEIKKHLELIAEQYPDWLKFIQVRKRLYLKISKETNINEMLVEAGIHKQLTGSMGL